MAVTDHRVSRLRRERQRQGLSLREMAHFARVSHMTIQRLEVGTLDVAPSTKARVARVLRMPVSELFPPEDDARPAGEPGAVTTHHAGAGGEDVLS